jgi:hypothetical protein
MTVWETIEEGVVLRIDLMTVTELAPYIEGRVERFFWDSPLEEHNDEQREMLLNFLAAVEEMERRQREIENSWSKLY